MNVGAIVQARMGSTRLPGKVLLPLGGRPSIELMLERLARSREITTICIATSTLLQDDPIAGWGEARGVAVFRGHERDVLARYAGAAEWIDARVIVRLTGDCPLICPDVTDRVIRAFLEAAPAVDYATNCLRRTYPRGLDTEVVSREALVRAAAEGRSEADREHVTHFIRANRARFPSLGVEDAADHSDLRWTVDTPADYALVSRIVDGLGGRAIASDYVEILALVRQHPEWTQINAHVAQKSF